MRRLMLVIGSKPLMRIWRQNVGSICIRDRKGSPIGWFHAGPPAGAADISGIVGPEGWRIEIETKGAVTKQSEAQIVFGRVVTSNGGIYIVCRYDAAQDMDVNLQRAEVEIESAIELRRRMMRAA